MGRHYRDEEPVPHPQDRTPRVPAEGRPHQGPGRSEASGAFRTPGRSSISAAFGIAGRATGSSRGSGESSGSAFFTEGAEAPGFQPEAGSAHPAAGRPAGTRRGETSGSYPVASSGESTVTHAPQRRGTPDSYPTTTLAEVPGAHPAANSGESTMTHAPHRGGTPDSYPTTTLPEVPGASTTRSRRKGGGTSGAHPAGNRIEAPGAHPAPGGGAPRASRRGEASGSYPAAAPAEAPGAPTATRSRRKGGKTAVRHPESAAERTEVITRQDEFSDDLAATSRNEASGTSRTLDRSDDTGSARAAGRGESTRTAERGDTTGPHRTARDENTGPQRAGRSEGTGTHRIVGKADATGSHRIVGKKAPRRRIATWPIACLVLAVLIGLGVVGWNWADNELNSRAEAQAASCDGGTSHMRVVVTPSAQKPLAAAADRWNQAATVVHGQCVHVMIEAKPSAQVLDALVGRANLDSIGGLPAAWLPESSYWVSELTTKKPEMIGSPAQSVANARSADYPFIGLTGPGIDDTVLRAAQTFREYLEQPAQQADFAAAGIKSA
ncbi:hypothetical protein AB0M80_20285 [Amycolatopsis sp. NPDC051045]|uniref:hypothetical protein n=1 Tax=Amycolatopsis sp. NPDC051045 TaxID=3156922 RepID=UPI0034294584